MTLLQSGIAKPSSGYDIDQSLRFDHDSSARLTKEFSGAGTSRRINTFSAWIKPSLSDTRETIFGANGGVASSGGDRQQLYFQDNTLRLFGRTAGSNDLELYTNQVFRDPSAWYHILVAMDSTQSTAANRAKIYVNGEQVTSFATETYWAQNYDGWWGTASPHGIGVDADDYNSGTGAITWAEYFGGYLAEVHFIDGQALTPASFGETDSSTNQWVPVEVTGLTYGTNGFYEKFSSTELANSFSDSSRTFIPTENITADFLVIGGGGGGGNSDRSGGGGAGGYRTSAGTSGGGASAESSLSLISGSSYAVTVGAGGAANNSGSDSSIIGPSIDVTSLGGGKGANADSTAASSGGSGGGGGMASTQSGASGTSGQGYAGGNGASTNAGGEPSGGGGGGAGAVGVNTASDDADGGAGGAGVSSSITGSAVTRAGGGGGGAWTNNGGAGGSGGGGAGGRNGVAGTTGTANTGRGGGGGGTSGGSGGSGIVIIRYAG